MEKKKKKSPPKKSLTGRSTPTHWKKVFLDWIKKGKNIQKQTTNYIYQ